MELKPSTQGQVVYTHKMTKIGSSYKIECLTGNEPITTIKDFQKVEPMLRRRKIWDTTQGVDQLPKIGL